jgi:hypothetical protein
MASEKQWSWDWRFNPSFRDDVHAIGVVVLNFNHLELMKQELFIQFSGLEPNTAQKLFLELGSSRDLDMLKRFANDDNAGDGILEHTLYFIEGFDLCSQNRNVIAHSLHLDPFKEDFVLSKQVRKQLRTDDFPLTVVDLRRAADDICRFDLYAHTILEWRLGAAKRGRRTKPRFGKPQKPLLLNPLKSRARKTG